MLFFALSLPRLRVPPCFTILNESLLTSAPTRKKLGLSTLIVPRFSTLYSDVSLIVVLWILIIIGRELISLLKFILCYAEPGQERGFPLCAHSTTLKSHYIYFSMTFDWLVFSSAFRVVFCVLNGEQFIIATILFTTRCHVDFFVCENRAIFHVLLYADVYWWCNSLAASELSSC